MAWPKRVRSPVNRHIDGKRASIGDGFVEAACVTLGRAAQRECNMHLEHFEGEKILNWFFDEDLLRQVRLVKEFIISPSYYDEDYMLPTLPARLVIGFKGLSVPPLLPVTFKAIFPECQPIVEAAKKAQEIQRKYARVKNVLRWFNRNATASAIRAYWPPVMALCPNSPALRELETSPTRYTAPRDIGLMLPLIRETASTVAAMQLIPADIKPRERGDVWFNLMSCTEEFDGVPYLVENLSINV